MGGGFVKAARGSQLTAAVRPPDRTRGPAGWRVGWRLSLLLIVPALMEAGCDERKPRFCLEDTKRCLTVDTREARAGGKDIFAVRLGNTCREDVEYKLCFEVPGETADCRQDVLAPAGHTEESIALGRFGGRSRLFVRYVSEARACRFPLTSDVRF